MPFTPIETLVGGILLHISTATLLSDTGRVLGVSSLVDGAVLGDHAKWRWAILTGMALGPAVAAGTGISLASAVPDTGAWVWSTLSPVRLAIAGALVGFGSKLGSGCTSGHFLCGVSRLSPRSLVSTGVFFSTAVAVAKLVPAPMEDIDGAFTVHWANSSTILTLKLLLAAILAAKYGMEKLLPRLEPEAEPRQSESDPLLSDTQTQQPEPTTLQKALQLVPYVFTGLTFALGLQVSGMLSPLKVMGFLRMPPPLALWDPSLAMVFLFGVVPNGLHWYMINRRARDNAAKAGNTASGSASPSAPPSAATPKPHFSWEQWRVPKRSDITWQLVTGALCFGAGWGLAGVCPGPALVTGAQLAVSAVTGPINAELANRAFGWAIYIACLLAGMAGVDLLF